ncbi:MAG TPA: SGNH/GDSL hydrolase family protein [Anaerolineae bacterium]|nr:SGNH/GDSL hydrolase family protein [Anaerolineae bacterium]
MNGIKIEFQVWQDTGSGPCVLIPNLQLATKIRNEQVWISTNRVGMHWREVALRKPENTQRIAFVGDSFTFGMWANRVENSFVGIVDAEMRRDGFEVLNFGVPGDGLAEAELRLQNNILAYSPDYIVLMFYNGNDLSDTYLGAEKTDCSSGELKKEVIEAKIPPGFRGSWEQAIKTFLDRNLASFRALRLAKERLFAGSHLTDPNTLTLTPATFKVDDRFLTSYFWSRTETPPLAEQAVAETLRVLDRIWHLCQKHRVELIIMAIPFRGQVYALPEAGAGYDIALPQRHLEQYAKREDIPYYDLLPPLRSYVVACREAIYVENDIHFNTQGHRIVGQLISKFLADRFKLSFKEQLGVQCLDGTITSIAGP